MRNSKLCLSVILTINLASQLAYAEQVDGNSLLNSIKNNDHENIKSIDEFFDGYINGVADATVDVVWCPSHNLKGRQLQKIITKYYKSLPKDSSEISSSAKDLVLTALVDAHPCKK